ncbi:MAG: formylmethanofuran dehydrogenase subunit C [Gammaproteobacteria bacterium]|nr:formylmethanofuran dehydrogenase subunit C [Gammaproteobacteria bacterium]
MGLALTLHTAPSVPLEAEQLCPDRLAGMSGAEVEALPVMHGNERVRIGDFFRTAPRPDDDLHLEGDLARVKLVGAGMTHGRLIVHGDVGTHLGSGMQGGEILVEGNAADWIGAEMIGGRIVVRGHAGHMLGAAYRGSASGMRGGEILVHGHAGNEVGNAMRRGLIAVAGDAGDFAGVNLLAGTIFVGGQLGQRPGAGMRRGTIATARPVPVLPTFEHDCRYRPVILRLLLLHLIGLGLPVDPAALEGDWQRWSGDAIELNRGELLVLAG